MYWGPLLVRNWFIRHDRPITEKNLDWWITNQSLSKQNCLEFRLSTIESRLNFYATIQLFKKFPNGTLLQLSREIRAVSLRRVSIVLRRNSRQFCSERLWLVIHQSKLCSVIGLSWRMNQFQSKTGPQYNWISS